MFQHHSVDPNTPSELLAQSGSTSTHVIKQLLTQSVRGRAVSHEFTDSARSEETTA